MKNTLNIGSVVTHASRYGMQKQSGLVVDNAGTRYGRQYVWVAWIAPKTLVTMKTAFWTEVLRISPQSAKDFLKTTAKSMGYAENKS